MALLKYLKPAKDCLPDPRRFLSASISSCVIAQANSYEMFTNSGAPYVFIYVATMHERRIHTQIHTQPF